MLPGEVQRGLVPNALDWLTSLDAGRYSMLLPSLVSSGGNSIFALTSKVPPAGDDAPSLPVRPARK